LQAEFDYLDDEERRAFLAHQRTARAVIRRDTGTSSVSSAGFGVQRCGIGGVECVARPLSRGLTKQRIWMASSTV
jgi:hypothetical protein